MCPFWRDCKCETFGEDWSNCNNLPIIICKKNNNPDCLVFIIASFLVAEIQYQRMMLKDLLGIFWRFVNWEDWVIKKTIQARIDYSAPKFRKEVMPQKNKPRNGSYRVFFRTIVDWST